MCCSSPTLYRIGCVCYDIHKPMGKNRGKGQPGMCEEGYLEEDRMLAWESISAKQGHFGSSTEYIAARRKVVHKVWGAKRRLLGLLPPKAIEQGPAYLDVPEWVVTEEQLLAFVDQQRPGWLRGRRKYRK